MMFCVNTPEHPYFTERLSELFKNRLFGQKLSLGSLPVSCRRHRRHRKKTTLLVIPYLFFSFISPLCILFKPLPTVCAFQVLFIPLSSFLHYKPCPWLRVNPLNYGMRGAHQSSVFHVKRFRIFTKTKIWAKNITSSIFFEAPINLF